MGLLGWLDRIHHNLFLGFCRDTRCLMKIGMDKSLSEKLRENPPISVGSGYGKCDVGVVAMNTGRTDAMPTFVNALVAKADDLALMLLISKYLKPGNSGII